VSSGAYWSVVIPVKLLQSAKTRLDVFGPTDRAELARAMALDTIAAAIECAEVAEVVVVTDEVTVDAAARELGAVVVRDEPAAGLNAALEYGAEVAGERRPNGGVVALAADLPAMRASELAAVLTDAAAEARAVVADADGDGTVALTARSGERLAPAYGTGSFARHQQHGAVPLGVDVPGLRRDVDTVADLRAALRLGCGPRTTAAAAELFGRLPS
jgi:2-phospho-L-lactate guanylyltransferase